MLDALLFIIIPCAVITVTVKAFAVYKNRMKRKRIERHATSQRHRDEMIKAQILMSSQDVGEPYDNPGDTGQIREVLTNGLLETNIDALIEKGNGALSDSPEERPSFNGRSNSDELSHDDENNS
ncbi:MAG: hypothetical protein ABII26_07815 [Pseudomonadota bacterium]